MSCSPHRRLLGIACRYRWSGGLGVTAEVSRKPPKQLVAAENPEGDLTDDPVSRQGLRQDAHNKANHCGAAIE